MTYFVRIIILFSILGGLIVVPNLSSAQDTVFLTWKDLLDKPAPKPDKVIPYGQDSQQYAELWLPHGQGPHPVVVLVHGGCWSSAFPSAELLHHMAATLRDKGVAVWNLEYRQVGHSGGGFPGTFQDVAAGADFLRKIASANNLDINKVVSVGHSAGGSMALWLAVRHRLSEDSPLYSKAPLRLVGAVSLGGGGDLKKLLPYGAIICGENTIEKIVGLNERDISIAFSDTSPAELLPSGVKQIMIHGVFDPVAFPYWGWQYQFRAKKAGEYVDVKVVSNAAHFEIITPWTPAWHIVEESILTLIRR